MKEGRFMLKRIFAILLSLVLLLGTGLAAYAEESSTPPEPPSVEMTEGGFRIQITASQPDETFLGTIRFAQMFLESFVRAACRLQKMSPAMQPKMRPPR